MLYSPHPYDRLLLARERAEALRRDADRREPSAGPRLRAVSLLRRGRRLASGPVGRVVLDSGHQG